MSVDRTLGFTMPSFDNFVNMPITNWEKFWNIAPKVDIDLFSHNTGDGKIEQAVVNKVGSYGRQLGRITKVVAILLEKARNPDMAFSAEQEAELEKFDEIVTLRAIALAESRKPLRPDDTDRVLEFIETIHAMDDDRFQRILEKCKKLEGSKP